MPDSALSRRYLLRAGFGALAAASTGGIVKGANSGRRVLVCIYLFGGNDSNNMVVPLDDPQFSDYAAARGRLAIPANSLLEVRAKNQARYGFHPALSELRDLYASGALAVAANVGHLQQPLTRSLLPSFGRSHLPGPLDSSLAFLPEGYATLAWAATLAGAKITDTGHNVFTGFPGHNGRPNSNLSLVSAGPAMSSPEVRASLLFAAGSTRLSATFPNTGLGHELRQVASLIATAGSMGIDRQVYFVTLGGFGLSSLHAGQLQELSRAMSAFHSATVEMGVDREVTTFTDTEFNRALKPDAQGSLAPAWGGHQFVMGSQVHGGDVYGAFPSMALGGPDDADSVGVWIPRTSKHQFHATLASWSGVPSAELSRLFPRLSAFSQPLLNFVA